jgi:hypothetical protein
MADWTDYRSEYRERVIVSPRGNLTNHHWTPDGLIGRRVTKEEATHVIVTKVTVEPA